ncbi:YqjD family protein [Pseudomonas sp. GV071]|jgi:ElaB/YqjD/DUF883 family membrane-anchored ribosome-binding protein|uniref:DUF883 family protein n=1 Tax=Pseudomonas sp. GV071 TaxID=2135754 RepID=UPI000D3DB8C6|nr:DUF883 family protein [Pseudomonas sp. GV071]PTQ72992.1 ElaB/YqjD/DUF883 family membrane-anchored ribosome-binding protein [Pseudomonas sp. GV071]
MAIFASRNKSLHSIETEIEHLISSLDSLKSEVSEESQKSLKTLRSSAERVLGHSRDLLSDTYADVKEKTYQAGVATRDLTREHPVASASLALGVVALAGYLVFRNNN